MDLLAANPGKILELLQLDSDCEDDAISDDSSNWETLPLTPSSTDTHLSLPASLEPNGVAYAIVHAIVAQNRVSLRKVFVRTPAYLPDCQLEVLAAAFPGQHRAHSDQQLLKNKSDNSNTKSPIRIKTPKSEVPDEHFQTEQPGPVEDDDGFVDTDSEISEESDFDPTNETLADRLYALRDIVPPTTRGWIASSVGQGAGLVRGAAWFSAKALWVLSTSAILIGVPWALAYAEEQNLNAMEQEYRMRETGGELLTAGSAEDGSTAERVSAALNSEGRRAEARPAL